MTTKNEFDETEILQEIEDSHKPKKRKRKPILPKLIGFFIILLLAALGLVAYRFFDAQKPIQSESAVEMFVVDENSTLSSVIEKLEAEGFIKDAQMTYYYARYNNS